MSIQEWNESREEWTEQHSREIQAILRSGQSIAFEHVPAPDGSARDAYALYVTDSPPDAFIPYSPVPDMELRPSIIALTDEKLLAKLRSIKGQFTYMGFPLFYYEYCEVLPRQGSVNVTCLQCGAVFHIRTVHCGKLLRCVRCGADMCIRAKVPLGSSIPKSSQ
jgi:hypothetical protein